MKTIVSCIAVLATVTTLGCANMTETQQRSLSGAAMGAAGGAAISAIAGGDSGVGAAVGGAAGALSGYLMSGDRGYYRRY